MAAQQRLGTHKERVPALAGQDAAYCSLPSHPVGLIRDDGDDEVQRDVKTIRAWLEANSGRSADRRYGGRALPALT